MMTHRRAAACCLLLLLLALDVAPAQEQRIRAMGGMTLAVRDSDYLLNPYDFAGNPAWLLKDERTDWLKAVPSVGGEWGGLRRRFDPASTLLYGAGFDGVKTLFDKGTFRGIASYDVERHNSVYRSLKRYPYAGEAFFVTDTTTGDFTYSGPAVQFMYSYELFPSLAIGASVRYQIQDGLKDTYSRVKSLYRNLQSRFGVTLELGEEWVVGATLEPWDTQESLEAKSEESFEVEIFNYRGDTYATRHRSTSVDHKVRKKGMDVTGEVFYRPEGDLEVGLRGGFGRARTLILVPKSLEKEVEEGLARPDRWDARLQARWDVAEGVSVGVMARYRHERTWSEHSALDLLLWDWKVDEAGAGVGVSARLLPGLLAGVEVEYAQTNCDSSKYIDGVYRSYRPSRYLLRVGAEARILPGLQARLGGWYGSATRDLVSGAADLSGFGITAGAGVQLSQNLRLDAFGEYGSTAPEEVTGVVRGSVAGGVTLTLLSF